MTTFATPPPPSTPPPALTPGGRTAIRALVVVVATVAVVGTVVALGSTAWRLSTFRVVADERAIPTDTTSLVIDARDAPAAVRLTTDHDATEPRVSLRLVESSRAAEHTLAVSRSGGDTVVAVTGGRHDFPGWGRASEITVTLPPDMARRLAVTTRQDAGALIAQADVDTLTATTSDGAVLLSGSARRIEVHTTDANIVTRQPISVREAFIVDTIDGDVTVDFAAAPRRIDAKTDDGDVVLGLPDPGPYAVRAAGNSARVRVAQTDDPARASAEVTVQSADGNAVLNRLGSAKSERIHR